MVTKVKNYKDLGFDSFLNRGPKGLPSNVNTISDISNGFNSAVETASKTEKMSLGQSGSWTVSDSKCGRILVGYQKSGFTNQSNGSFGDHGIKVSREGVDVSTAGEDDLILSSAFNNLKVTKVIETVQTPSDTQISNALITWTVNHGLGYVPVVMGSFSFPGGGSASKNPLPFYYLHRDTGFAANAITIAITDVNSISITYKLAIHDSAGLAIMLFYYDQPFKFKFYCLKETAAA